MQDQYVSALSMLGSAIVSVWSEWVWQLPAGTGDPSVLCPHEEWGVSFPYLNRTLQEMCLFGLSSAPGK